MSFLNMLAKLTTAKIAHWGSGSDDHEKWGAFEKADIHEANAVTSERTDKDWFSFDEDSVHAVAIDLDVPAYLVPSSTPGHSHLYVDVSMKWETYAALLKALADAGVIEQGYYLASVDQGSTTLRLPWVKKGQR